MKKIVSKIIYIIVTLTLSIFLVKFASGNQEWIELNYSRNIYLKISSILSNISGSIPISLYELLIACIIIYLLFSLYTIIKNHTFYVLINSLLNIFVLLSTLMFLFWGFWGINNYRYSIDTSLGIKKDEYTAEELYDTCKKLSSKANEYRKLVHSDENGVATVDGDYKYLFDESKNAYDNLSEKYDVISDTGKIKPKAMMFSEVMSYFNFTGVYNPFFSEANINIKEPLFKLPFTICHELAHQKGFPKENEANFISFLACINSDDVSFKYAGYLSGLIYCTNALYGESNSLWQDVRMTYSEGVVRDMKYLNDYWNKYQGFWSDVAETSNNKFLQYTNQPEGTKSYGLVVDLIIAYFKQ